MVEAPVFERSPRARLSFEELQPVLEQFGGLLADIAIEHTTESDWDVVLDLLMSGHGGFPYRIDDGATTELTRPLFRGADETCRVLHVFIAPEIVAQAHFSDVSEIELVVDPREITSQADLDVVTDFMKKIGDATAKPVGYFWESQREVEKFGYWPANGAFTVTQGSLPTI